MADVSLPSLVLSLSAVIRPINVARVSSPIACSSAAVRIRLVESSDLTQLAELTTSSLFGEADLLKDGPFIAVQRQQLLMKNKAALARRIEYERTDSECRFFVAVEQTEFGDRICGCVDLAVRLFNKEECHFDLQLSDIPEGSEAFYRWSPYMASVAVNKADRRSGIGKLLLQAAEGWATFSGYDEIMLEVSMQNEAATAFYGDGGYSILSSFGEGEGGGGAKVVVRRGGRWEMQPSGKYVMRKGL